MFSELRPIHVYTRKQAMEDGSLIDLTTRYGRTLDKYGIVVPVAMTAAAFATYIEGPNSSNFSKIAFTLRRAAKAAGDRTEINLSFQYLDDYREGWFEGELKSVLGPDDDGNPCITLMMPDED